ncbi:MAG TPA: hypothetical protein ACFYD1_02540 [Candidatus Hypogeohydataceae bacterium YC38]
MARPSKTLFTIRGKISLLFLPLVLLISTFLIAPRLGASNGGFELPPGVQRERREVLGAVYDELGYMRDEFNINAAWWLGRGIREIIADIVAPVERLDFLQTNESGEMPIERDIEDINDIANNALGYARDCHLNLARISACRVALEISLIEPKLNRINCNSGTISVCIAYFRYHLYHDCTATSYVYNVETEIRRVRDFLSGTVVMGFARTPRGYMRDVEYNIETVLTNSENILNSYLVREQPDENRWRIWIGTRREDTVRVWNELRESQEFRELSDMVADLERRRNHLNDIRNRLVESFARSRSRAESIMAEVEAILRACEEEEGGRKARRPPKAEEPLDLSGTWVEMKGDKPVGEWEIKAVKKGKITLIEPLQYAQGKVIEYSGSIEGTTLTARHIIKDPAIVDPKIPKKVIETAIQEYMPTWDLDLKVSKEGTIEGKKTGFLANYNPETLKVAWVKPRFERDIVLKRKGVLAKGPTPAENCMESLRSFNREVQEYVREWQNFLDARDSLDTWQANFNSAVCLVKEELERAIREADVDNPDSCEVRKREALRHVNNASTVVARRDVDSTFAQLLESHQNMSGRYNALLGRRQELEDCLRQLERTENPTDEQVELMGIARTNLDSLNYIQPPELEWNSLDELKGDIQMRLSGLSGAVSELDCRWRMFERINMKLRALGEEREILRMLLRPRPPGEELSPEELERIRAVMRGPLPEELTPEEQAELRRRWESVYDNIRGRR